jgi:hypothetical protein
MAEADFEEKVIKELDSIKKQIEVVLLIELIPRSIVFPYQ